MKRALVLLFTILFFNLLYADIAVKSFQRLDRDMTARIDAPKRDQNGDVCAIIKVVTPETGFAWESDGLGIIAAEHKTGEYWIYIPHGAGVRRLTIKHQLLGVLRDYLYPIPIEKATVYEMVLTTGRVITTVEETIHSYWLTIKSDPEDALIYFQDQYAAKGEYPVKIKPGRYSYRVERDMYHTEAGIVEIGTENKVLEVKLKPAFGHINITTQPESGAEVFMDGKPLNQQTPCTTDAIASGEYTLMLVKDMYQTNSQRIKVEDGKTTQVNVNLQPNFADLTVNSTAGAEIYINNQQKGTSNWSGRLIPAVYSLEARLTSHRPAKQDIEIIAGENQTINLQPLPIYGSLDVVTKPTGARITIDGKDYGTTPNTVNKLLVGNYTVELSKAGFASVKKEVIVTEGKSVMLSETLVDGRQVTINSTPQGANLYVDGVSMGTTPYHGSLTFGNHALKIEKDDKTATKNITIDQTGGETNFALFFEPQNFTETAAGSNIDMVYIKEGTFMMGSPTNEKDRESDETQHQVSLSGFYIGKYTVTFDQYDAFCTATNRSKPNDNGWGRGKRPVINVNWIDANAYCNWLSQKTGKTYRLPTEAEWEYACRAGTTTPFNTGNNLTTAQANYDGNYPYNNNSKGIYRAKTLAVGSFAPNAWGLYDMHGNVWEWCNDWYGTYSSGSQTNPQGPNSGSDRVLRGGSWGGDAGGCRSANRNGRNPDYRYGNYSFRVVLVP